MKTIWKFQTNGGCVDAHQADTTIKIPRGSRVLDAALDPDGNLCVWFLVDPASIEEERTIFVRGTGHDCTSVWESGALYIGSVVDRPYVWHVFVSM
jgi:hypothetical protein